MEKREKILLGLAIAAMGGGILLAELTKPPAPPAEYVCPYCGEKFNTVQELHDHIIAEHPDKVITVQWE